ncbi:MAG: glycine zipper 2TM domain-containing protein [Burkholderiaceae bacterium]|nr:glycine zipper 2TM domain-containing protein [Burkholderiaceae bacterium]
MNKHRKTIVASLGIVAGLTLAAPAQASDRVFGALVGAGAGAIIGHVLGGDRGAAIGTAIGAVAGAGAVAPHHGHRYVRAPAVALRPVPGYYPVHAPVPPAAFDAYGRPIYGVAPYAAPVRLVPVNSLRRAPYHRGHEYHHQPRRHFLHR